MPLTGSGNTIRFLVEGQAADAGQENESNIRDISAGYFSTMGIPVVAGRVFNDVDDTASAPKRVVVNMAWVKRYIPGGNPIGARIKFTYSPKQPFREIVGVVGDNADAGLDGSDEPILFLPFLQDTNSFINYVVRTANQPGSAISAVREALREVDPQLILIQPLTMEQIIAQSSSVFTRRYPSFVMGVFAGLALILATVGLFGLVSYSISQRTREVALRVALGAQQHDIMRLMLGHGIRLTSIGVAMGVLGALALTRLIRSLLFDVNPADPITFAAVSILVTAVSVTACFIPTKRAMRADPGVALRYE